MDEAEACVGVNGWIRENTSMKGLRKVQFGVKPESEQRARVVGSNT